MLHKAANGCAKINAFFSPAPQNNQARNSPPGEVHICQTGQNSESNPGLRESLMNLNVQDGFLHHTMSGRSC